MSSSIVRRLAVFVPGKSCYFGHFCVLGGGGQNRQRKDKKMKKSLKAGKKRMEERQEAGKTETTKENEGKQNGNKKSKKAPALEDNRRLTKSGVHAGEKRPAVADWRVAAKEHLTLGDNILYCNTLQHLTLGGST